MADPLTVVRRATARRSRSEQDWREAVKTAVSEGQSLRAVAGAAGVSHVRVLQITREQLHGLHCHGDQPASRKYR